MRALSDKFDRRCLFAMTFLSGAIAAFLLVSRFLREPLHIEYGLSWAIFGLFATLNLQYVSLVNRLQDKLYKRSLRGKRREKAKRLLSLLVWTSAFFMITIVVLGLRICLHSFCPECQGKENPVPQQHPLDHLFLWLDRVMVSTFLTSLLLRVVVFFCSYFDNLTKSWNRVNEQPHRHPPRPDTSHSAPSS